MECVGTEFEEPTELAGRCSWPEAELLHERRFLAFDQLPKLVVEVGEFGVLRDGIQGAVVSTVSLILPNVD